jgi:HPt (histidine-containing phosphotransfer) domain-containing protein
MTQSVLDPAVFGEMRELMGDVLGEFVATYLDNTLQLISKIEAGLANNAAQDIYQCAHQLKGGSGSIGAQQLAAIALEIEKIGKAGSCDGVAPLLTQLKAAYALVEAELTPLR